MLKYLCFIFLAIFSSNASAIYFEEGFPKGEEVDLKTDKVKLVFSQDIIKLGEEKTFKEEHKAKLIATGLKCDFSYEGLKTVVCKLKEPLHPGTHYKLEIDNGFQGIDPKDSFTYRANHTFKTTGLVITDYQVNWDKDIPVINLTFNLKIKDENRSGIIECSDRELGVIFEPLKDKKGDNHFRVKASGTIKASESCVFYFNRPLSYRDYAGSVVPSQKILLDQDVKSLSGNTGVHDYQSHCRGNYNIAVKLFSSSMPYLKCEFNDAVNLGIYVENAIKVENFVQVIPRDDVKVTYESGNIYVSNFAGPNKNYIIKISKNLPLPRSYGNGPMDVFKNKFSKDVYLQVETLDNPPLLAPVKSFGVIEKDGPWQIGYSALNVKSYSLQYDFKTAVEDLKLMTDLNSKSAITSNKKTYKITAADNVNQLLPINVKDLAKDKDFEAGVFLGRMEVGDVDPKFEVAEKALFEDASQIKERREFSFGYLFTDIGLHVKKGKKGVLVWATSLAKGKPLSGVKIQVFQKGAKEYTAKTDSNGLAFIEDYISTKDDGFTVVATKGEDVSFVNSSSGAWNAGISRWDFSFGRYSWVQETPILMDIVAERPLYLPKEKVHLKFFVRNKIPDSIELKKAGEVIKVTIMDSRENEVKSQDLKLNEYGTAVMDYDLPAAAPTGRYSVIVKDGDATLTSESVFQVEEFRKPEFKVVLSEKQNSYDGAISYFKGGAVKDLPGELVVMFKKVSFKPQDESLNRFQFPAGVGTSWDDWYDPSYVEIDVLSRNPISSDSKGHFSTPKAEIMKSVTKYGAVVVEGAFQDENGGSITGRIETKVNPFDFIPGVDLTQWMYKSNERIEPEAVAMDKTGKAALGIKMNLKVIKVDWFYERRLGSGNYFYYDSRKIEKEITSCSFVTAANYKACPIVIKDAGYYEFVVEVADKKLKAEASRTGIYVYAAGEFLGFEATNHDRINLTVESTKLKLGSKLKVMAISPLQDGEALITLERDGILHSERLSFSGNVILFEKELKEEKFIPGFFVSVVIVKGRTSDKIENKIDLGRPSFKIGYKRVEVANHEKRLNVSVKPKSLQLEPGQTLEANVELKDAFGKGVQGELAIAVVDDALLSLAGAYQKNYDILDTFYSLGTLGVENYQTLTQLIGRRTFGKKGANQGGGGGFEVRSDFKNTAYWNAQIETDKDGKFTFKFKVPDNLTTWRIIAVAVDKAHRFGMGDNEFLVSKSLMIEPALPNFLVDGDKFNAKVVVTNRSGAKLDVNVEAKSSSFEIAQKNQSISVAHDDKGALIFPVVVTTAKLSDLTFLARGGKVQDGFKIDLPVLANSIKHSYVTTGIMKGKQDVALSLDPKTIQETLTLSVKTSSTVTEGLDEVFRYILHYPYGCWEQQLSSAYFLVQYEAFKDVLTFRFKESEGSISKKVQDVLDKARDYQSTSGGMRYYPGGMDEADVYLSTFTAGSFVTLKQLGYKVDAEVEKKLRGYLRGLLNSENNWSQWYTRDSRSSNRAYILSVLEQLGEKNLTSYVSKIYAERNTLDLFGLAFFTRFLSTQKGFEKEAKALQDRLDSLKEVAGIKASFREPNPVKEAWKFWSYTEDRSTCAALQAQLSYSNKKESLAAVVRGILENTKDGRWYNTQENFFCFEAIRLYAQVFEKNGPSPKVEVSLDGKEVETKPVLTKYSSSILLSGKEVPTTTKALGLKAETKDELYYTSILRFETPYAPRMATQQGFSLKKTLWLLTPKDGKPAWSELKGLEVKVKRGDIIKVHLDVITPSARYQVMLNDSLAGGLEPINTQLATTSIASGDLLKTSKSYQWESPYYRASGFEYMDLRQQAAQFYARKLAAGTYEAEYLLQAIATGEFTMPESTVEEMYYPDVRGTEAARKIIVNE